MARASSTVRFNMLRVAFESEHYASLLRDQTHHDSAVRLVAQMLSFTTDVEWHRKIVASALPKNYEGNTLDEIADMVKGGVRKGFASKKTKRNGKGAKPRSQTDNLIDAVAGADHQLFHDDLQRGFLAVRQPSGAWLYHPIRSRGVAGLLRKIHFQTTRKAITEHAVQDVIATLEAIAIHDRELRPVFNRIGGGANSIYLDLGRTDGMTVAIDATGWRTTHNCPVAFYRSPGFGEIPIPQHGGSLDPLRQLLRLEDDSWHLILSFLLSCLRPKGPYFCMLIEGEQGSGKSFISRVIRRIIDPHQVPMMRLPDSERDLMIQAKEFLLLVFDNVSGMKGDLSDALCSLATGAGLSTRRLYTDDEIHIFKNARPFVLNGISEYVSRPDLLDRAIPVALRSMASGQRRTEEQMEAELSEILPGVLGALYAAVAHAFAVVDRLELPTEIRMADAAKWIKAAEPATGTPEGELLNAIVTAQEEVGSSRIFGDHLVVVLQQILRDKPFSGTVGELFEKVQLQPQQPSRYLPQTPAHLSKALARLRPPLAKIGIFIEHGPKVRFGKLVMIWTDQQTKPEPAKAPAPPPIYEHMPKEHLDKMRHASRRKK